MTRLATRLEELWAAFRPDHTAPVPVAMGSDAYAALGTGKLSPNEEDGCGVPTVPGVPDPEVCPRGKISDVEEHAAIFEFDATRLEVLWRAFRPDQTAPVPVPMGPDAYKVLGTGKLPRNQEDGFSVPTVPGVPDVEACLRAEIGDLEERAAIFEFDAGMDRTDAEALAGLIRAAT